MDARQSKSKDCVKLALASYLIMVYFVCEACNETLKKAQVERHLYSCKACWGVTCVDCNFTFEGDSFRTHTSCVSEDQKYQGALYKAPKAKQQKNRGVNEIWGDTVQRAADNASQGLAPKALSGYLLRMRDLGNVPRQEKKFKNFTKNSLRVFNDAEISKLWSYIDTVRKEVSQEEEQARSGKEKEKAAAVVTPSPAAGEDNIAVEEEARRRKPKKGGKRAREEGNTGSRDDDASSGKDGEKSNGDGAKGSAKRRVVEERNGEEVTAVVIEAEPEEARGDAVDVATRKALMKAVVGILKKAPEKKLVVKELVKQAVVSAKGKGEIGGELDRKSLKRALRQRLKKCGTVDIRGGVAYYTKSST